MDLKPLLKWSQRDFNALPWRVNRSLYRTLVSEIMLQQTTVGTVKNHFDRFLLIYPNLTSLAKSSEHDLLVAWKGLGYYRRAKNLKKIAEAIFRDHGGEFPEDRDGLEEIPGIGPYTANALLSIGMDRPALALDANLERVIARLYGIKLEKGVKLQKEIQKRFAEKKVFPDRKISFRALNEALMDLGRTYCQARKAHCELCPLKKDCVAFHEGNPLTYPVLKETKPKDDHELDLLRVFILKKGKLLVYKKNEKEWLSGQFEVPTFILRSTDAKCSQYPTLKISQDSEFVATIKTGITKYSIKNFLYFGSEKELKSWKFSREILWIDPLDAKANLSTATLKGLRKVL